MQTWLVLIFGSAFGGVARYFLSAYVHRLAGHGFPHGTLVVNLVGCFLIGVLVVLSDHKMHFSAEARLFLIVGFCGAFTTFSTFIFESSQLIHSGETLKAFANVLGSVILGFLVFRAGVYTGNLL